MPAAKYSKTTPTPSATARHVQTPPNRISLVEKFDRAFATRHPQTTAQPTVTSRKPCRAIPRTFRHTVPVRRTFGVEEGQFDDAEEGAGEAPYYEGERIAGNEEQYGEELRAEMDTAEQDLHKVEHEVARDERKIDTIEESVQKLQHFMLETMHRLEDLERQQAKLLMACKETTDAVIELAQEEHDPDVKNEMNQTEEEEAQLETDIQHEREKLHEQLEDMVAVVHNIVDEETHDQTSWEKAGTTHTRMMAKDHNQAILEHFHLRLVREENEDLRTEDLERLFKIVYEKIMLYTATRTWPPTPTGGLDFIIEELVMELDKWNTEDMSGCEDLMRIVCSALINKHATTGRNAAVMAIMKARLALTSHMISRMQGRFPAFGGRKTAVGARQRIARMAARTRNNGYVMATRLARR